MDQLRSPRPTGALCSIPTTHPCMLWAGHSGAKGRVKAAGGTGGGLHARDGEPPTSLLLRCIFRGVKSVLHNQDLPFALTFHLR